MLLVYLANMLTISDSSHHSLTCEFVNTTSIKSAAPVVVPVIRDNLFNKSVKAHAVYTFLRYKPFGNVPIK